MVLSPPEVRSRLAMVKTQQARMCRRLIYACGVRLTEGTQLQISDIDAQRMRVRGRQGKGGTDRFVPLAPRLLEVLRMYWRRQRPRPWGCPARHRSAPLAPTSLQKTFNAVVRQSGMAKDASIPPLRHAYATHLWARGGGAAGHPGAARPQAPQDHRPLPPSDAPDPGRCARHHHCPHGGFSRAGCTAMPEVAEVFRRYGGADLARFGADLLPSHRRALEEIRHWRPEVLGGRLLQCDHGGQEYAVDHACRNHSGPKGHRTDTEAWREERRQELLPVPDVHVVFTAPHELGEMIRRHQRDLDEILLRAAAPSLMQRAMDPHDVGGLIGGWCVLHPWTRTLAYHPHVHCRIPAGAVSPDRTQGQPARTSYLVPVHALAKRLRGRFRALLRRGTA